MKSYSQSRPIRNDCTAICSDISPLPGTYSLILSASTRKPVVIGKLGTLRVIPGYYVYVGSAFGPGGLKARLKHHLHPASRPHWHMDYLSPVLRLREIWYTGDQVRREHQWAAIHVQTEGAVQPLPGFGASDCRCPSHLFYYKSRPSGPYFRRKIKAEVDHHARIVVRKSADI